jgi:hypothetical protein
MPPVLVLRYSPEDITAALLASAPTEGASVSLYRSADPHTPELLAVMRLPGSDQDPELTSWVPYSWYARSGEHLVLHFDHQTLLDIITTHARDLAARTCWSAAPRRHAPAPTRPAAKSWWR